jgi:hypothetical protein
VHALRGKSRLLIGTAFALALLASASLALAAQRWDLKDSRHLGDSERQRIRYEGDKKGRISIVDISVRPSEQTFRNRPHGPRLRVYRVKGTFNAQFELGNHWQLDYAKCSQVIEHGFAVSSRRGRAFFPRARIGLRRVYKYGSIGLSLHGLNVSLPFGQVVFYEQRGLKPGIEWRTPSDQRHSWVWHIADDVEPQSEQLTFIGHWAAPAPGIEFELHCRAWGIKRVAIFGDSEADARVHVQHSAPG